MPAGRVQSRLQPRHLACANGPRVFFRALPTVWDGCGGVVPAENLCGLSTLCTSGEELDVRIELRGASLHLEIDRSGAGEDHVLTCFTTAQRVDERGALLQNLMRANGGWPFRDLELRSSTSEGADRLVAYMRNAINAVTLSLFSDVVTTRVPSLGENLLPPPAASAGGEPFACALALWGCQPLGGKAPDLEDIRFEVCIISFFPASGPLLPHMVRIASGDNGRDVRWELSVFFEPVLVEGSHSVAVEERGLHHLAFGSAEEARLWADLLRRAAQSQGSYSAEVKELKRLGKIIVDAEMEAWDVPKASAPVPLLRRARPPPERGFEASGCDDAEAPADEGAASTAESSAEPGDWRSMSGGAMQTYRSFPDQEESSVYTRFPVLPPL